MTFEMIDGDLGATEDGTPREIVFQRADGTFVCTREGGNVAWSADAPDGELMFFELCAIFDTALVGGVENIAFLMSSLTTHDLNVRFGAAKEKLKKFKPDFNFDFSRKVDKIICEKLFSGERRNKKTYSLYAVVYGFILLLDCFLQIGELDGVDKAEEEQC